MTGIHIANPSGQAAGNNTRAQIIAQHNIDIDVFGLSAYPQWGQHFPNNAVNHMSLLGTLNTLYNNLNPATSNRQRHIMNFETSHPFTYRSGNMHEVIAPRSGMRLFQPISVQGSANAIRESVALINALPDTNLGGVFLWEPAMLPDGQGIEPGAWEYNFNIWETYGTGWATSYGGAIYDTPDAGTMFGGGAHSNQSLWDFDGMPLGNLAVMNYIFTGARPEMANAIDVIGFNVNAAAPFNTAIPNFMSTLTHNTTELTVSLADWENLTVESLEGALPSTMRAFRWDNSHSIVSMTWDRGELESFLAYIHDNFGANTRAITGRTPDPLAEGGFAETTRYLTVAPPNLVTNHSFGTGGAGDAFWAGGTPTGWTILNRHTGGNLSRQIRTESFMARTNGMGFGWYRPIPNTFTPVAGTVFRSGGGQANPAFSVANGTQSFTAGGPLDMSLRQVIPGTSIFQPGYYSFEAYIAGEHAGVGTFYMRAFVNPTSAIGAAAVSGYDKVYELAFTLDGYRQWSNPTISGIHLEIGDTVHIEFDLRATRGSFGTIGDVYFYLSEVTGAAGFQPGPNLLLNPGFEDGPGPVPPSWTVEGTRTGTGWSTDTPLSGARSFHWNGGNFQLLQTVTGLVPGIYSFSGNFQGQTGQVNNFIFVRIGDEDRYVQGFNLADWNNWQTPQINSITLTADDIAAGVRVGAAIRQPNHWGTMDDFNFNQVGELPGGRIAEIIFEEPEQEPEYVPEPEEEPGNGEADTAPEDEAESERESGAAYEDEDDDTSAEFPTQDQEQNQNNHTSDDEMSDIGEASFESISLLHRVASLEFYPYMLAVQPDAAAAAADDLIPQVITSGTRVPAGTVVTFTAAPAQGNRVIWPASFTISQTNPNSATVTINADTNVTINFQAITTGTGGGGRRPGGGSAPRPVPTATPAPTPTPAPAPIPPTAQENYGSVSSQLAGGATEITLSLGEGIIEANLDSNTMELLAEAGVGLTIAQDDVNIMLPAALVQALSGIGETFQFIIVIEESPVAGAAAGVSVRATIDGVQMTAFASPVTVVVYLGNLEVTWSNPNNLVAVLNPVIQGIFSAADNTFTFDITETGDYILTDQPDQVIETEGPAQAVPAAPDVIALRFVIDDATYTRNGIPMTDPEGLAPFIDPAYDRTMVPLRLIAEALGADVAWDGETRTVIMIRNGYVVTLQLDAELSEGMGRPVLVHDRTFVPVAYVSQMLGADVRWDGDARAVYIRL